MPNWNEVIVEIQQEQIKNPNLNPLDTVRRKYLKKVSELQIETQSPIILVGFRNRKPQVQL